MDSIYKTGYRFYKRLWLFFVWDMPGIVDHFQAGIGQLTVQPDAVSSRHNAVVVTRDYQDRQGDLAQPANNTSRLAGEGKFPKRLIPILDFVVQRY